MHNIDRTQAETWETSPNSYENAYENSYENSYEMEGFNNESGAFEFAGEFEAEGESWGEMEYAGPLNEADEMELAAQLLEVNSEEELDQFIGGLFKKVSRGLGKVFRNPAFKMLGGALKGIAKKALPIAGVGTALGAAAGNAAGQMFGLELEGMSAEDQEFEVARRVVRLGAEAAGQVADAPPNAPPQAVAQQALRNAAATHAPGLVSGNASLNGTPSGAMNGSTNRMTQKPRRHLPRSGRWMRQGRNIVLLNIS